LYFFKNFFEKEKKLKKNQKTGTIFADFKNKI